MNITHNGLEVKVSLRPTVREINRPEKKPASAVPPVRKSGRFPRVAQILALALQFQEMIDTGEVRGYADLARLGCVSRERISQIMILTWLAPDIQQEILMLPPTPGGRFPVCEDLLHPIARQPLWDEQRSLWRKLKQEKQLEE
jgi:hypothetical protein